jgi:anti-anti-sigma factor
MADKLEVRTEERDGGVLVFTVSGPLFGTTDGYTFQNKVRDRIAEGAKHVILDLAGVGKIDSSGIGILVATMWSASQAGTGLTLASISRKVEEVLSIAMLLDHVDHADSVDEAIARIG